ncbi:Ulp1 protease family [Trypanosoma melophagium]|uniref:Ulp1 protease family n=1 Tax=Trypanosoma melophagium TaxID=715481 RepID=UPI00351A87DF|nr:Ulp1 protease family [Trypanosoma melophagium]
MTTIFMCKNTVKKIVDCHLGRTEGLYKRALDHYIVPIVITEVIKAIHNIKPEAKLFCGVQRQIREGKAVLLHDVITDEEDAQVYRETIELGKRNDHSSQSIAVSYKNGLSLTYEQLTTLGPGRWLNDQIINAYISMICEERNSYEHGEVTMSMGTHFFAKIEQELRGNGASAGSKELPPLQFNSGILRWLKRRQHILFPGKTRIILVPINLSQTHWALAALNWENKTWVYYDSYIHGEATISRGKYILRQLAHTFSEARRILCNDHNISEVNHWHLCVAKPSHARLSTEIKDFLFAPQQQNMFDCGVFVCYFAWCLVNNVAPSFTQDDVTILRRVMVHELLLKKSLRRLPMCFFTNP